MNSKYILANWKMNCLTEEAATLASGLAKETFTDAAKVVLFPPATSYTCVAEKIRGTPMALGGQDCSVAASGAFTGDISALMLKDAGCAYVIVGHSERRTLHQEDNATVKGKAEAAIAAGLIPVICVGESDADRDAGRYLQVIEKQLKNSLPEKLENPIIIAYEPVWAIGTGKTATTEDIEEVHKTIASLLTYAKSGSQIPVVYGGSVKAANAHSILSTDGVDGVLVGGASLNVTEFLTIIRSADENKKLTGGW